jgi:hypothetical protein
MPHVQTTRLSARLRALVAVAVMMAALAGAPRAPAAAEEPVAYVVQVSDVTAKVGQPAIMLATLKVRDGYRILKAYNNRVIALSSFDDGVVFEHRMVPAAVQDDGSALLFEVSLRATKPGKHPINGVFRVGYMQGTDEMAMVSLQLIANVTGTE